MTKADYNNRLAELKEVWPDYSLIPRLEAGYSLINSKYLERAIELNKKRKPKVTIETDCKPLIDIYENRSGVFDVSRLYIQKSSLFQERAKLSNQFHHCKSNKKRAEVSDQIREIQGKISEVMQAIRAYEKDGEVKEVTFDTNKFDIPEDPVGLMRKLNSTRSYISKLQREIRTLMKLPDGHPDLKKLNEKEAKLKELKIQKAYVERLVKEASVHGNSV